MSLTLGALRELVACGLTAEQILRVAEAQGESIRSAGAERQRRYRERKASSHGDVTRDVTSVTSPPPETRVSPGPPSQAQPTPPSPPKGAHGSPPAKPTDEVRRAFDAWNDAARRLKLPLAKDLTAQRRRAIAARLADVGPEGWAEALTAVERSRFCRGDNDRGFRADLDFVCQAKSFQRLREGFYGEDAEGAPSTAEKTPDQWRSLMRLHVESGRWKDTLGPVPGEPGCKVPSAVLAEFGLPPPTTGDVVPFRSTAA